MGYFRNLGNGHPEKEGGLWGERHSFGQERQSRLRSRTFGARGTCEKGWEKQRGWLGDCVQKHGTCGDPEQMKDGSEEWWL